MRVSRGWHVVALLAWGAGTGCTALREIPRAEYVARPENRTVRVETTEGLVYELDTAKIEADTLVGYRRRDVQGPIDEYDTLRLPLDRVSRISARRIDWLKTGVVGGLSMAAVVVGALTMKAKSTTSPAGTDPECRDPSKCP